MLIVANHIHRSKVNDTQEDWHVDASDWFETFVDISLVLEIFDESLQVSQRSTPDIQRT
jgi:hypothetical protein